MIAISRKKSIVAIALILAICLYSTLTVNQPAQAATLQDLNQCADYAKPSVESLFQNGVINGNGYGYFNPQQTITRAEMITLIVKSLGLDNSISPENTDTFNDVPENHWANKYVEIAYQTGITSGVAPGQFGVNQTCTREQMITLYVRTFKLMDNEFTKIPSNLVDLSSFADEAQISDWARDPIAFSVYTGLINGTSPTTMDPKTGAEKQQVAVLTDRFMSKKDNIVADMQAQRILGKAVQEQLNGQGISNTEDVDIKANLQQNNLGLPEEISFKAHMANEILWPDTLHQVINTEITGLPSDDYSKLDMEQYLVDGVLYQKIPDKNNQSSWVRTSLPDASYINKLMQTIKDTQTSEVLLPDEIHKYAQVKLEDAVVNGTNGHKITYDGQITDMTEFLNQILSNSLPAGIDNGEYKNLVDIIKQSVKSITFSEVIYIGEDNHIYGSQLNISIDTSNSEDIPVKSIMITINTDNYKYQDISIVLPAEAENASEN